MDELNKYMKSLVISSSDIENLVIELSCNFTQIISIHEIKKNPTIYWGGNGVGNRWANKKFNYSVIYSGRKSKTYSENIEDTIPDSLLNGFKNTGSGITGIYVHSKKTSQSKRPINKNIHKKITLNTCVICGSSSDIVCDHKNDLYNDPRVLDKNTQILEDFQPLCNHCNLQKRQVCKYELQTRIIYSAKKIQRYKKYNFEFPWEKKIFDENDIKCKEDTYWFDPVEFEEKIYKYIKYKIPILIEIKKKFKSIS
jgi:hypothetical protein